MINYNIATATETIEEIVAAKALTQFVSCLREEGHDEVYKALWYMYVNCPKETFINLISRFNHIRSNNNE